MGERFRRFSSVDLFSPAAAGDGLRENPVVHGRSRKTGGIPGFTVVSGALGTAFYVWRRDLLANMIAHVTMDFIGIIIPSLLAGK
jgi:hypothetical protein